ncbi:MAG TPA: hypothetical protein VI078_06890 [bacterium]
MEITRSGSSPSGKGPVSDEQYGAGGGASGSAGQAREMGKKA